MSSAFLKEDVSSIRERLAKVKLDAGTGMADTHI
jgi:hypothetical protein